MSDLVGNPEDQFSQNEAQIHQDIDLGGNSYLNRQSIQGSGSLPLKLISKEAYQLYKALTRKKKCKSSTIQDKYLTKK